MQNVHKLYVPESPGEGDTPPSVLAHIMSCVIVVIGPPWIGNRSYIRSHSRLFKYSVVPVCIEFGSSTLGELLV